MMNNYNSLNYRKVSKFSSREPDVVGNSPNRSSSNSVWRLLNLFVLFLVGFSSSAQIGAAGSYTFANTTNTFSTIVGGSGTTAVTLSSMDDGISSNIAMPFSFNFSNTNVVNFQINSNGWLGFNTGTASTSTTNYSALSGTVNNVISAFNRDLNGNNTTATTYYYQVSGTAPNRILKVEWVNIKSFSSTINPNNGNFQIWLYETSNVVEIRYGTFASSSGRTTAGTVQVGIRGGSTAVADVRSLSNTAAWATPTLGTSSTATNALGTFAAPFLPDSGRTFTFTPPVNVSPPSCIALPTSPANAATAIVSGVLTWPTASGGPTGYKLYFGTDAAATNLINGTAIGNVNTYTVSGLLPSTVYYWKVQGTNAFGEATGCVTWSFTTGTVPNCVTAPSPADLATAIARNPTLSWTAPASPAASSYDVYFGTSATPPFVVNQTGVTYTPGLLLANTTYYWQIVPKIQLVLQQVVQFILSPLELLSIIVLQYILQVKLLVI